MIAVKLLFKNSFKDFITFYHNCQFFCFYFFEERFRNSRDEMNVEIISKEIFLKELEVIVNTYEDIYNDNEIQKIFETFKENF